MSEDTKTEPLCLNCNTSLAGPYCYACGEKKFVPSKEFKLYKFIEQTIDGFTHFDSKFIKSFFLLLLKPGFLTLEYITGRRVKYMKPIQAFLIASLIFYFVFPHSSAYFNDAPEMNHGYATNSFIENTFHYDLAGKLNYKAIESQSSHEEELHKFRIAASDRAKTFLFVIVPFLALFLLLLFRKAYPYYIVHVIFALHSLSFFLLLDLFYIWLFRLFGVSVLSGWLFLPLILIYSIHLFFSARLVYKNSNVVTLLKVILTLFLFLCVIIIYRQVITILTAGAL